MAYFVLALGVLMSAAGLDAIATGYPIIQVERGWATVISGSVLLTGGLVTIAVGLVARTLSDIRAALQTRPPAASAEPSGVRSPLGQAEEPASTVEIAKEARFVAAAPVLAAAIPATFVAEQAAKPIEEPQYPTHLDRELLQAEPPAWEPPTATRVEPAPAPGSHESRSSDAYELQTPSTPDHDLAPAEPRVSDGSAAMDDWLDQAFSEIDQDLAAGSAATTATAALASNSKHAEPEHPAQVHVETVPEETAEARPVHAEDVSPTPSEVGHLAEAESEPVPHDLVVIGRYEADGTCYVMYSDGSIEAQSDAGVYRFGSMAELRAFIED